MRIVIFILILAATSGTIYGQYNITSNAKCIASLTEKSLKGEPSINTAINFLEAVKTGRYKQWQSFLSKDFQQYNKVSANSGEWWHYLSSKNIQYQVIAEQQIQRNDKKTIYFNATSNKSEEKLIRVMLVRENLDWKVQSVEL